jgi:hypothetical protein
MDKNKILLDIFDKTTLQLNRSQLFELCMRLR